MNRFNLEVYLGTKMIFCKNFRSITNVAKCIDYFIAEDDIKLYFYIYDVVKGIEIDSKELMRIWHC